MKKLENVSVIVLILVISPLMILAPDPFPPYNVFLARQYPNNQHENHHILLPETELDLVVLDCQASGYPDPEITFFKDGSIIRNNLIPGIVIDESYNYSDYSNVMCNISGKFLKRK